MKISIIGALIMRKQRHNAHRACGRPKIIAVLKCYSDSNKGKPKNLGSVETEFHDFCATGALLYLLSYHGNWELCVDGGVAFQFFPYWLVISPPPPKKRIKIHE